jgi:hypothetical protein
MYFEYSLKKYIIHFWYIMALHHLDDCTFKKLNSVNDRPLKIYQNDSNGN